MRTEQPWARPWATPSAAVLSAGVGEVRSWWVPGRVGAARHRRAKDALGNDETVIGGPLAQAGQGPGGSLRCYRMDSTIRWFGSGVTLVLVHAFASHWGPIGRASRDPMAGPVLDVSPLTWTFV